MLEHKADRARLAQVAAVLGQNVAYVGDSTGSIVGHAVDHHGRAANAITLVADFFVTGPVGAARAARYGAQYGVFGPIGGRAFVPCQPSRRVAVRSAAAGPGGTQRVPQVRDSGGVRIGVAVRVDIGG